MRLTRDEARKLGVGQPPTSRGVGRRKPLQVKDNSRSTKTQKYRNVKTTVDGVTFHSKREANRYGELRLLEKAGKITDLVLQPKFEFVVNGVKIGTYSADFTFYDIAEQRMVVEDAKGFKTQQYKLRVKLMKALHDIDVREV